MRTVAVAAVFALALPASAHSTDELDAYFADWNFAVADAGGITPELLADHSDMRERHPWYWQPTPSPAPVTRSQPAPRPAGVHRGMGDNVEQWRGLVAAYFGGEVERALCLVAHESGGNPNAVNPSSGAAGLFQVMPFWWDHFGGDRFDPETNVRVAKAIRDSQGWTAWSPYNRGECR